jgi:hypothetical protein
LPGKLHRLTTREVETRSMPGRLADGGNLYLQVTATGAKSWVFLYRLHGRQREMGLGSAASGATTLSEARKRAGDARKCLLERQDPLEVRKAAETAAKAQETTFGMFADDYVKSHRVGWSNAKHADQWAMTLGDAYCKEIRSRPIAKIGVENVVAVLTPIWQSKPETARRLRMRLIVVNSRASISGPTRALPIPMSMSTSKPSGSGMRSGCPPIGSCKTGSATC